MTCLAHSQFLVETQHTRRELGAAADEAALLRERTQEQDTSAVSLRRSLSPRMPDCSTRPRVSRRHNSPLAVGQSPRRSKCISLLSPRLHCRAPTPKLCLGPLGEGRVPKAPPLFWSFSWAVQNVPNTSCGVWETHHCSHCFTNSSHSFVAAKTFFCGVNTYYLCKTQIPDFRDFSASPPTSSRSHVPSTAFAQSSPSFLSIPERDVPPHPSIYWASNWDAHIRWTVLQTA